MLINVVNVQRRPRGNLRFQSDTVQEETEIIYFFLFNAFGKHRCLSLKLIRPNSYLPNIKIRYFTDLGFLFHNKIRKYSTTSTKTRFKQRCCSKETINFFRLLFYFRTRFYGSYENTFMAMTRRDFLYLYNNCVYLQLCVWNFVFVRIHIYVFSIIYDMPQKYKKKKTVENTDNRHYIGGMELIYAFRNSERWNEIHLNSGTAVRGQVVLLALRSHPAVVLS